jgi:hypothetical protein
MSVKLSFEVQCMQVNLAGWANLSEDDPRYTTFNPSGF